VNIAAGNELSVRADVVEPASATKRVLIAGGGPAGLEAARTAALRGHEVFLYEMTSKLGGQATIAASAPHRGDFGAITAYLADEIERLGVKVVLRTFVEPDLVEEMHADVVIVATGSTPRRDGFQANKPSFSLPGTDLPHVYTGWDVLGFGGQAAVGRKALVFEDSGSYECICVSEALLEQGAEVTLVSSHRDLASAVPGCPLPEMYFQTGPARERLLPNSKFHFLTNRHLTEITPTDVEVGFVVSGERDCLTRHEADTVVLIGYNTRNRELFDALSGNGVEVHAVGDASGGSTLRDAIREAAVLARTL
jgi:hypothetical protein